MQLRLLTEFEPELAVAYAKIVAVSVDPVEVNAAFRAGLGAKFPILSDAERVVQQELGLLEPTDLRHKPYLPFDFVLYPDLRIYKIYNGYYYWGRASLDDLRRDFRQISSEIRRDWDPFNLPEDVLERARARAAGDGAHHHSS
ncbi:MAG TPA: redoxin domain-containing protein [Chloroflexota bacterium]|nr:redoxin domain-containing protein [Chloroflexota bacterium]